VGSRSALISFRVQGGSGVETDGAIFRRSQGAGTRSAPWPVRRGRAPTTRSKVDRQDFQRAQISTVPLTILILIINVLRAVAAGLPVAAFSGVLAAVGSLTPVSSDGQRRQRWSPQSA
jgi:hypothetical protein